MTHTYAYGVDLASRGYVVLRGAVPAETVRGLRDKLVAALARGCSLLELRKKAYELDDFRRMCESPHVHRTVSAILEVPRVFSQPRRFVRVVDQDRSSWSPPHQDHYYVGGSTRTLTAWVPLSRVGPRSGSLLIDARPPGELRRHVATTGFALPRRSVGPFHWYSPALAPGDVLLLGSLTVHATGPICPSARGRGAEAGAPPRLSVDFRVQPSCDPIWEANTLAPFGDEDDWISRYGVGLPPEAQLSSAGAAIAQEV
jgi:hypothetical protein